MSTPPRALQASSRQEVLSRRARHTLRRLAIAYGCAGAAQAIVITSVVLLGGPDNFTQPSIWLSMWIVMALPVAPTVAYVLEARSAVQALWIVLALGAALLFAGERRADCTCMCFWSTSWLRASSSCSSTSVSRERRQP